MPCEAEREAIKNAKKGKAKGQALQAYMKCKHRVEFEAELQKTERTCSCSK